LPEADGKRRFYEELKNSLMLRQVLGSDFRIISVPRSAYLDSEAVDHLSNSLAFLASDNIVTAINLRFDNDRELSGAIDISKLPASVTALSFVFHEDVLPKRKDKFWEKIRKQISTNTTLLEIETDEDTLVPEDIEQKLLANKQNASVALGVISTDEQQAREQLFGDIALTSSQKAELGADAMRESTISNGHGVAALRQDVSAIRRDLIGINRRLGSVEERLAAVEVNQAGMGNLLVRLAQNSSAISDRDLAQFDAMVSAINANNDTPALLPPSSAQEQYKTDFKFLTNSVLLNGMTRNMSQRQLAAHDSGQVGFNPFKMIGGLLYEVSRAIPLTAIVGAVATQGALMVQDAGEKKYWDNILKLSRDGSSGYQDLLTSSLAEHYQAHFQEPIPSVTVKGSIGNFLTHMIGKGISTGRMREIDPHAQHHVKSLFDGVSKQRGFEVDPNARAMATRLYQMQYPEMQVAAAALPHAAASHHQPRGNFDGSGSSGSTRGGGSRSSSDEVAEAQSLASKQSRAHQAPERAAATQYGAPAAEDQGHVERLKQREVPQEQKRLDFRAKVKQKTANEPKKQMFSITPERKEYLEYMEIAAKLEDLDGWVPAMRRALNKTIAENETGTRLYPAGSLTGIIRDQTAKLQGFVKNVNDYLDDQIEKLEELGQSR
jgi:hypothetical protein